MEAIRTTTSFLALRNKSGTSVNSTFDPQGTITPQSLVRKSRSSENSGSKYCVKNGVGDYVNAQTKKFERTKNPDQKQKLQQELVKTFSNILKAFEDMPEDFKSQLSESDKKIPSQIKKNLSLIQKGTETGQVSESQTSTSASKADRLSTYNTSSKSELAESLIASEQTAATSPTALPRNGQDVSIDDLNISTVTTSSPTATNAVQESATKFPESLKLPIKCQPEEFLDKFVTRLETLEKGVEFALDIGNHDLKQTYMLQKEDLLFQASFMVKYFGDRLGGEDAATTASMIKNVVDTHTSKQIIPLKTSMNINADPSFIAHQSELYLNMIAYADSLEQQASLSAQPEKLSESNPQPLASETMAKDALTFFNQLNIAVTLTGEKADPTLQQTRDIFLQGLSDLDIEPESNPTDLGIKDHYNLQDMITSDGKNVSLKPNVKQMANDLAALAKEEASAGTSQIFGKAYRSLFSSLEQVGIVVGSKLSTEDAQVLNDLGAIHLTATNHDYDPADLINTPKTTPESKTASPVEETSSSTPTIKTDAVKKQARALAASVVSFAKLNNVEAANEKIGELFNLYNSAIVAKEFIGQTKNNDGVDAYFQKLSKDLKHTLSQLSSKSPIAQQYVYKAASNAIDRGLQQLNKPATRLSQLQKLQNLADSQPEESMSESLNTQKETWASELEKYQNPAKYFNDTLTSAATLSSDIEAMIGGKKQGNAITVATAYKQFLEISASIQSDPIWNSDEAPEYLSEFKALGKNIEKSIERLNIAGQRAMFEAQREIKMPPPTKADAITSMSNAIGLGNTKKSPFYVMINGSMYKGTKKLGSGGFGDVFLVEHPSGKTYALKITSKQEGRKIVTPQEASKELNFQAKIGNSFSPEIYSLSHTKFNYVALMEVAEGDEMFDILEPLTGHPTTEELDAFNSFLDTHIESMIDQGRGFLQELKDKNIEHHDFKLENMLMSKDGTIKFIDFGLAESITKNKDGTFAAPAKFSGTPLYINSNYFDLTPYQRDQYCLGCVYLYFLAPKFDLNLSSIFQMQLGPGAIRKANADQTKLVKKLNKQVNNISDPAEKLKYQKVVAQINEWMGNPLNVKKKS